MFVREIFGISSFSNGFNQDHAYTHKTKSGMVITVNAGGLDHSVTAARAIGAAGNSYAMQVAADSQLSRANNDKRSFTCTVYEEIKLLSAFRMACLGFAAPLFPARKAEWAKNSSMLKTFP